MHRAKHTMKSTQLRSRSRLTPSDALAKSRGNMPTLRSSALLSLGLGLLALNVSPPEARAAGTIQGSVKLVGKAPEMAPLNMKADPFCAKQPAAKDDEVAVGAGGGLKNVVIRVAKGVASPPPPPSAPAVMDQNGCRYRPRVLVVQAGQTVEIRNSDSTLHNVHTYKGTATLFNLAHIQGTAPYKKKFPTVGDVVKFKCDVHPWMTGFVLVTDNPYHAVSGDDGSFSIPNVPPGKYTVEVWHERFGTQTKEVTVSDGKPVDLKLELNAK
jgi:plastocyanin